MTRAVKGRRGTLSPGTFHDGTERHLHGLAGRGVGARRASPPLDCRSRRRRMITWATIEELVTELEDLQRRKVIDLARRLRPGLTLEDVRNPHDFPELGDPDWQHADGVLTGIQSVLAAVRARQREDEPGGPVDGNGR